MRCFRPVAAAFFLLVALLFGGSPAAAAPLTPGGLLSPVPLEPDPTGGVVIASSVQPIVSATYTADFVTTVLQGDPSNPHGGLTFTYEIQNVVGTESINRISILGYDGQLVDASYRIPAAGAIAPAFMDREIPGDALGISFTNAPLGFGPLVPGTSSATLVFQTGAPTFVPAMAFTIDGSVTGVQTLAPIPEPATLTLCGLGAIALMVVYRRRTVLKA